MIKKILDIGGIALRRLAKAAAMAFSDPEQFRLRLAAALRRGESGTIEVNGVNFRIDLGLDPAMRQMLFGFYQIDLLRLLRRFLRPGDTFIDVGANIGYISAFALGLVGGTGCVHAFEPVPKFLRRLRFIQEDNPGRNFHPNGLALGDTAGTAAIAVSNRPNIGWNTMVPGFMPEETVGERLQVPVTTLDEYLMANRVAVPRLVKIDTEGYELPVIRGFAKTLAGAEEPPILLVEVAPAAYPKLGLAIGELAGTMQELGYECRDIRLRRRTDLRELRGTTDVVFLPR